MRACKCTTNSFFFLLHNNVDRVSFYLDVAVALLSGRRSLFWFHASSSVIDDWLVVHPGRHVLYFFYAYDYYHCVNYNIELKFIIIMIR